MPTSNASDLPLAASRGRLAVMHLAVLVPEIPGASGAIGRSRPTPSGFACAPAQQAGICFVTLASQGARQWTIVRGALAVSVASCAAIFSAPVTASTVAT